MAFMVLGEKMKPGGSSSPAVIGDGSVGAGGGAAWPCTSVSSSGSPPSSAAAAGEKPGTYGGKDDDVAARSRPASGARRAGGRASGERTGGRAGERRAVRRRASGTRSGWMENGGRRWGRQLRAPNPAPIKTNHLSTSRHEPSLTCIKADVNSPKSG